MASIKFCNLELDKIYYIQHKTKNGEMGVTQAKYLGWHTKTVFGFKVVFVYDLLLPWGEVRHLCSENTGKTPDFYLTLEDAIIGRPIEGSLVYAYSFFASEGLVHCPSQIFPGVLSLGMPVFYWDGRKPQKTFIEFYDFEFGYGKGGYYRKLLPGKGKDRKYYRSGDECRKDNIIKVYTF